MVRRTPIKPRKTSTLWIFCEGQTEKRYFNNLRINERLRLQVKPKVSDTNADQIVSEAIKFMKLVCFDDKRDMIACVFDKDDESQNSNDILSKAKRKSGGNVMLIYSNPSFEYWILCHDGYYPSSSYNQSQVYELVKTKLNIDTKKEMNLYLKTKDDIELAKKNAKKIQKRHEDEKTNLISRESTPLSLVYQIIEIIDEFK